MSTTTAPTEKPAWLTLKAHIDEAMDQSDPNYLLLEDIDDESLFTAAEYAQMLLNDRVRIRRAFADHLTAQGHTVELGEAGLLHLTRRGETGMMTWAEGKWLVIEIVKQAIMIKRELRELKQLREEMETRQVGEKGNGSGAKSS